jgi:hypothetical protein
MYINRQNIMTKSELKQLIREAIQELKLDDGVALQFVSDTGKIKRTDYPDDIQGLLKYYADSDKLVVDFDFSKTRLDDLIVFDNKPVKIEKVSLPRSEEEFISDRESGVVIPKKIGNPSADLRLNAFVPYKFKSINDIADDYYFSKSKISNVYYDRPKLISNLKNYLRRAIKNMASTPEVTLSSENISQIREMVKNGVARFDNESGVKISDFDVIIKVPSSAPLNDVILEEFKKYVDSSKTKIVSDLIFKKTVDDITVNYKKWMKDKYKGSRDKQKTIDLFKQFKKGLTDFNKDREFQIKSVYPTDHRAFVKDFLKFNPNVDRSIFKAIYGGKILIIDDTIGAKKTMRESVDLIARARPSYVASFALLEDWGASRKF